jgi:hypothetical protein
LQEHIRQSRESKLDEIERHSTKMTKSRENIALQQLTKIPPPSFDLDSMTPINISSTADNQFYHREEKEHSASNHDDVRKSQSRNDLNMREQEIKHIFGSSYHDSDEYKDNSEMCDTACQTRYVKLFNSFHNKLFSIIHSCHEKIFLREKFLVFFHAQFLSFFTSLFFFTLVSCFLLCFEYKNILHLNNSSIMIDESYE